VSESRVFTQPGWKTDQQDRDWAHGGEAGARGVIPRLVLNIFLLGLLLLLWTMLAYL
jgi:hypothetical protein